MEISTGKPRGSEQGGEQRGSGHERSGHGRERSGLGVMIVMSSSLTTPGACVNFKFDMTEGEAQGVGSANGVCV